MSQSPIVWGGLVNVRWPKMFWDIVARNVEKPPLVAAKGMPLENAPIDHVALALECKKQLFYGFSELTAQGGQVVDEPRLWPYGDGCRVQIPWQDEKWMASVAVRPGFQVTLLSPAADGDVISKFLTKAGDSELHHVAFLVPDILNCQSNLRTVVPGLEQISKLAVDEPLSQVFHKASNDLRIVEFIERRLGFLGGFTCRNIATLTEGERRHSLKT